MPTRLAGPCRYGRCPRRGTSRGYCDEHAAQVDRARGTAAERGYTYAWQQRARAFLEAHRWCKCGKRATEADHILTIKDGLARGWTREQIDADSNLRPFCKRCHSRRTALDQSGWGAVRTETASDRGMQDHSFGEPQMEAAHRQTATTPRGTAATRRGSAGDNGIAC
jgi:5-methylcytosine-specific restriction enzyme A